jgi:hypothetical protein
VQELASKAGQVYGVWFLVCVLERYCDLLCLYQMPSAEVCACLNRAAIAGDDDENTRKSGRSRKPRRDMYAEEEEREEARKARDQ